MPIMFAQLCSWDNLYLAWRKASKGKRGRMAAATFEHRLEDNLLVLQDELWGGYYQPGAYYSFTIHEPKRRLIRAAPFRDRVVHHALCNMIEPMFERSFVEDSYANRVGKGTHRALERCQYYARRHPYVLQCDIQQFFPSIDHNLLLGMLARKIDDPQVMALCEHILNTNIGNTPANKQTNDDGKGLPIGNLTSQFWANCYLNGLDHFVKRKLHCPGYVRYVDDLLLFGDDKAVLRHWHDELQTKFNALHLRLHPHAHPQPVSEGIPFLGFITWPQRRRVKGRKVWHFGRIFRQKRCEYVLGHISLDDITTVVHGWVNHVRYANSTGLRKHILGQIIKI